MRISVLNHIYSGLQRSFELSSWSYVPWYLTRTLIDGATCLFSILERRIHQREKWTHRHENVSGKFKKRKMMNLALCLEHVVFIWRGERKRRNRRYRFQKMINNSRNFLLASIITMLRYVFTLCQTYVMPFINFTESFLRSSFKSFVIVWKYTQSWNLFIIITPPLFFFYCSLTEWREWRKCFTFKYFMEATKSCG